MEHAIYEVETQVEAEHWWFKGRRKLLANEITRLASSPQAGILDVGCGTGANLRVLQDLGFTNYRGLDMSADAVRFCRSKGLGPVEQGDLFHLPFADGSLDLVLATDVIEHVEDDVGALREMYRVLAPGGHILLTVPAFMTFWGPHDEKAMHWRRYRMSELEQRGAAVGFRTVRAFYFNYLLFGPIWVARKLIKLLGIDLDSEGQVNTRTINMVLSPLFHLDVATAPYLKIPFGVSAYLMARKPTESTDAALP